jgi:hypothetical protein
MNTHTPTNIVFTTSRGEPYRPSAVLAARYAKQPTSLRIVVETGEVLTDHYATESEATSALDLITYAMRGLVDTAPLAEIPFWATAENAAIASTAVLDAGGTRERAAQAFANTLMGIGDPASAIDSQHMYGAFVDAIKDDELPVLILAGMDNPDHSLTKDPLSKHSPLVKLALLAAGLGVAPGRTIFAVPTDPASNKHDPTFTRGAAMTTGEAGLDLDGVTVPRASYHWCDLNGAFFADWAGHGGPAVRLPDGAAIRVEFDPEEPSHRAMLLKVAEHFESMGWIDAAERARVEVSSHTATGPADAGP